MGGGSLTILPPSEENIQLCATAIQRGQTVVMPTETVYGLAADALNPDAVARVFAAKGRPTDNPLIVHLESLEQLGDVVSQIPQTVQPLASAFWPGPLTLVLPKKTSVPDSVTGGLDTVAVRIPDHPVAQALIRAAARPLCAPSANRFMALSPTRAADVDSKLDAFAILDGGDCAIGIESTVLDLTSEMPRILRPGQVTRALIEGQLGFAIGEGNGVDRKSPGQYPKHYSPRTPVFLIEKLEPNQDGLTFDIPVNPNQIQMLRDPIAYAAALYTNLHRLDLEGLGAIYVQCPPDREEWAAVWDRLRRATGVP